MLKHSRVDVEIVCLVAYNHHSQSIVRVCSERNKRQLKLHENIKQCHLWEYRSAKSPSDFLCCAMEFICSIDNASTKSLSLDFVQAIRHSKDNKKKRSQDV